jgi:hypothetical protein
LGEEVNISQIQSSLRWLNKNDYFTTEGQKPVRIDPTKIMIDYSYSLSEKALAVLSVSPEALGKPLGEKLRDAVKETGAEARKQAVATLIGQVLGGAIKGIFGS